MQVTAEPALQETLKTLKARSGSVSCGSHLLILGPVYKVCLCPGASLAGLRFDFNVTVPSYHLVGAFPLPLYVGYLFWWDHILLSMVV